MNFITPLLFIFYLQVMPPPPGGNGLQSWQVTEWFEDPLKSTSELGANNEYSPWRLRLALRPLIYDSSGNLIPPKDGGGKPVRGWSGYRNIVNGIINNIIIITLPEEWNILVEYANVNNEDIEEICDLAESKGNYIAPGCPAASVPVIVNLLLLCSFCILFLKSYNATKIKGLSWHSESNRA